MMADSRTTTDGTTERPSDLHGDLQSTTEILHGVLDSTADGILVVDTQGRIVTHNRRFADMWQLPADVLAERDDARALEAALRLLADPEAFLAKVQMLYGQPEAESFDSFALIDGRTFERFSRPLRVGERVTGRVWSFRDVTAQRRSEEKLRASEAYFRALTEKSRDLVAIIDLDGMIRYASPSHEAVLGYRADALVGTNARSYVHPDDLPRVPALLSGTPAVIPSFEFRFRHHDGSWRTLETVGTNLSDRPDINGLVLNSRDVTARRRAELRTEILLAIADDVAGHVDLEEIFARVQRRAIEALPADATAVICEDPVLGRMRVMAHQGLPPELAPALASVTFPKGELPAATRTKQGETVAVRDLDLRPWLPEHGAEAFATGSLVLAPFDAWSRHFGILVAVAFGAGRGFDDDQISLCTGVARQVALAMEATDLYRAQAEEANFANALARFGRDLIAHVNEPQFLDRLCESTATVLGCEVSATLLKRGDGGAFSVIAGHGFSTTEADLATLLEIPAERMAGLLARLADADVTVLTHIPDSAMPRAERARHGLTAALCMALRRGGEIVGVQVTTRHDGRPFSPVVLRIARDIAQSASLAISHAQLVEELEQANQVRAEFVATVSHELRTPLNIILGYGDLLLTDTFGPLNEEQRSTLERMDRRARELLDLVNSTLEVSRLERGRVPIDVQAVSIAGILTEVEAETRELQEKAGVPLVLDVPRGDVEVTTDRAKLKVVMKNLVGNALKFTERGCVTVRATRHDDRVALEVVDTGIGIAPGDLPVVFQAFRQVKSTTARTHVGVGLGLFIVARFVELLRGHVSVQSTVGVGSTFRVELPVDYASATAHDAAAPSP
ncbi:PAS domain S-box protein [Candidatus Binatia bacterium]|nr:PAS domain S-box protein [Candidatus Binatia bacterium]